MANRTDADYEIDAVTKARLIIECLVEEEPITEKAIVKKTGFKKDMVMRTLRTFRLGGWAVRNDTTLEWRVGPRLVRLATDVRRI